MHLFISVTLGKNYIGVFFYNATSHFQLQTEKKQNLKQTNRKNIKALYLYCDNIFYRTAKMIRKIPENITVTVITGNYYDEQMPGPLNKVS